MVRVFRRRQWHPTPVLLPGKSHGWRSLVGCSPWGREESDMTERLPFCVFLGLLSGGPFRKAPSSLLGGIWFCKKKKKYCHRGKSSQAREKVKGLFYINRRKSGGHLSE